MVPGCKSAHGGAPAATSLFWPEACMRQLYSPQAHRGHGASLAHSRLQQYSTQHGHDSSAGLAAAPLSYTQPGGSGSVLSASFGSASNGTDLWQVCRQGTAARAAGHVHFKCLCQQLAQIAGCWRTGVELVLQLQAVLLLLQSREGAHCSRSFACG